MDYSDQAQKIRSGEEIDSVRMNIARSSL